MKIERLTLFTAVAVILIGMSGCAGIMVPKEDQLLPAARYAELETYMESKVPDLSKAESRQLMYLCYAYSRLKKYNKLFPCLNQFEKNVARGDYTVTMFDFSAYPLMMRAEALLELEDYGKAVEQAERALEIVNRKDLHRSMRIYALGVLGLSYAMNGQRDKAEECARQLEGIGTYYPFILLKTDKLNGLAKMHMALGDFRKSLDYMREDEGGSLFRGLVHVAVTATGAVGTLGDNILAYSQLPKTFMLNKSLYETGQIKEAKAGYDEMLGQPRTADNADLYWMILFDRGRIAETEGNRAEAIGFYKRAIEVIEQQRSTINTEASKIGFVGNKQDVYGRLVSALVTEGRAEEAFEFVEHSKSRALVDLLAAKQDFAVDPGKESLVRELLAENSKAERVAIAQDTTRKSGTRSVIVKTRQGLQENSPELSSLVSIVAFSAPEIRSLIPSDEALVEFYDGGRGLLAFVLTREGTQCRRLEGGGPADDIRAFRSSLERPDAADPLPLARSIYDRLIRPLESALNKERLVIVPHGVLHYLPFNALHDGKTWLIDRFSLRMLPSASVIKYLGAKKTAKPAGILAFGNPDLGDPGLALVHAQEEARAVARTRADSKFLLGREATETALRSYGGSFRYLHFATHGVFQSDKPLKSALLLAPDGMHDGRLTVDKLYSMRIDAELVMLLSRR